MLSLRAWAVFVSEPSSLVHNMSMAQRYGGSVFFVAVGVRRRAFTIFTNALYFIVIVT